MRKTRQVDVGGVKIGGGAPIAIQSMSTFSPVDTAYAAAQINALGKAGADIVRVAVPDRRAAEALKDLKALVSIPLVADIHFDYHLALTAIDSGIDALRINPGNIGRRENVVKVVEKAAERNVPDHSRRTCWISTAGILQQKAWWKALCVMYRYWKKKDSMIS